MRRLGIYQVIRSAPILIFSLISCAPAFAGEIGVEIDSELGGGPNSIVLKRGEGDSVFGTGAYGLDSVELIRQCGELYLVKGFDSYGHVLFGLRLGAVDSEFELRGRLIEVFDEGLFYAPFLPRSLEGPFSATLHHVALKQICESTAIQQSQWTPIAFDGWGLGKRVYARNRAQVVLFPRPLKFEAGVAFMVASLEGDGGFVVTCHKSSCIEQPFFDDDRQRAAPVWNPDSDLTERDVSLVVSGWQYEDGKIVVNFVRSTTGAEGFPQSATIVLSREP